MHGSAGLGPMGVASDDDDLRAMRQQGNAGELRPLGWNSIADENDAGLLGPLVDDAAKLPPFFACTTSPTGWLRHTGRVTALPHASHKRMMAANHHTRTRWPSLPNASHITVRADYHQLRRCALLALTVSTNRGLAMVHRDLR